MFRRAALSVSRAATRQALPVVATAAARYCATGTTTGAGTVVVDAPVAEATEAQLKAAAEQAAGRLQAVMGQEKTEDGVKTLSSVEGISDQDRHLLRQAFHGKREDAPAHPGQFGGQGFGNQKGDMAAVFTCNVCKTRSVKRFTKHAYTKGIVLVQCPGCGNKHLLADNMGWFCDGMNNVEDILRAKGEEVTKLSGDIHIEKL